MKIRDMQRKRVYDAERLAWGGECDHTGFWRQTIPNSELQSWVDGLMAKRAIRARWSHRPISVTLKRGGSALGYYNRISLPAGGRNEWVMCHEIAHCLTSSRYAPHGPEFAGIYLLLVKTALGAQAAAELRQQFKDHRVRVSRRAIPDPTGTTGAPRELNRTAAATR